MSFSSLLAQTGSGIYPVSKQLCTWQAEQRGGGPLLLSSAVI